MCFKVIDSYQHLNNANISYSTNDNIKNETLFPKTTTFSPKTLNSLHTNKISSLNETKDTHFHNISETLSSSISSKDSIKYVKYIHYAFILFSINQLHLISNNTSQCNNKAKSKHYIYNI